MKYCLRQVSIVFWLSCGLLCAQSRSVLIGNHYSQYLAQEVERLTPKASIMLDQYVFTFDPLRKTLAKEIQDGAFVSINMYRAHASNPSTYYFFEDLVKQLPQEAQGRLKLNKYPGKYTLHAKHLSWQEEDRCACHIGSFNFTNLASEANKELMVVTYDDDSVYQECKEFHDTVARLCSQVYNQNSACLESAGCLALGDIPVRRTVITSLHYDINGSLITFIKKLTEGSTAFVGAYSVNDGNLIQALCDAAGRGARITFFLDGTTVDTKTERRLLQQLHQHGVTIFIYNYDGSKKYGRYSCKMHAKFYAAQQEGSTLVMISTQNFTRQFALNMASIHPQDEPLFTSVRAWCQELERECDAYAALNIPAVS